MSASNKPGMVFKNFDQLRELGFKQDEHGQWIAPNCLVNVYQMDDTFQVFVTLRTGAGIAFVARTSDTILTGTDKTAEIRTKQLV
jgi:hypothetical protein